MISPINYLLVFFVSLLGYLLGVGLGYIAPEELKPGKKYLEYLEKFFFALTFLPVVYFWRDNFLVMLPLLVMGLLLYLSFEYRAYTAFGVFLFWFFWIRPSEMAVLLEACAIFLYGLPAGSLLLQLAPAAMAKLNKKVETA